MKAITDFDVYNTIINLGLQWKQTSRLHACYQWTADEHDMHKLYFENDLEVEFYGDYELHCYNPSTDIYEVFTYDDEEFQWVMDREEYKG